MAQHRIIVVGASAGGVKSLTELVRGLPDDLPAAVFVVLHIPPSRPSFLPKILDKAGPLSASHPDDGEQIRPGHIYVAPPDHHLLVEADHILITKGPKENRFRPSVDALFRSAAYTYGSRVIGVVLSGFMDDGTSGLWTIKRLGGITVVQQPDDAQIDSMPLNAIRQVEIDYCVAASEVGPLLSRLVQQSFHKEVEIDMKEREEIGIENSIAADANALRNGVMRLGSPSPLACPECYGVLLAIKEGNTTRYRCHTGHAYSASSLLTGTMEVIGDTLWQAMRGMEECVLLLNHMGKEYMDAGDSATGELFFSKAREMEQRAQVIHDLVMKHEILDEETVRRAVGK